MIFRTLSYSLPRGGAGYTSTEVMTLHHLSTSLQQERVSTSLMAQAVGILGCSIYIPWLTEPQNSASDSLLMGERGDVRRLQIVSTAGLDTGDPTEKVWRRIHSKHGKGASYAADHELVVVVVQPHTHIKINRLRERLSLEHFFRSYWLIKPRQRGGYYIDCLQGENVHPISLAKA